MTVEFRYHESRAAKARLARHLKSKSLLTFVRFVIIITLILGVVAIFTSGLELSFTLIVPVILYIIYVWITEDVLSLPADMASTNADFLDLNKALSSDLLGSLSDPRSFEGIWTATNKTPAAIFTANRFLLHPAMFEMNANDERVADRVWQEAYRLSVSVGANQIDGAAVLVALLSQIPSAKTQLAQVHLEYEELENAIAWYQHIQDMRKKFAGRGLLGGVARDWTSGYTPVLSQLGLNVSQQIQSGGGIAMRDVESHAETVDQMIKTLSDSKRTNIALIGELGVGKTTTVYSFADRLLSDKSVGGSVKFNQVFLLDTSTILANIRTAGSLENLLITIVNEAQRAKNIILFLDNAELFFKNDVGAVDLKNVLEPVLEQGAVRVVLAMTPTEWQKISQNNESLASSVNKLVINPPEEKDVIRIMEDQALSVEHQKNVVFTYQSLKEAYRLAGHYIQEGEFPGKALKLMENSAQYADNSYVYEASVQQSVESSSGVKVQKATEAEKSELLNLEDTIHQRMINQSRAVKVVSDALRRARSGVNNPERPIGTFLFLGPTGVGKTELAKSVSAAYFGGDDNIIRIDLNEFSSDGSGDRLIEPVSSSGHGLVPEIRKQPFSVVLFDEIEKAHPKVLDLFLQLLDEGVLRDTTNKEVSFRDAIIIATSNAAAADIQKLIAGGHNLEEIEDQFVSSLINSGHFKPEFLNRFDEIVLFRPLTKDELLQVVDLIMNSVNKTLARQKVSVNLTDDAKQWLVDKGYDVRLGARPLRRMVQKTVENIVAKKLLESSVNPGDEIALNATDLDQQ